MSQPVPQLVDLGFSVADGEKIKVSCENQALRVSFVDWQEQPVVFLCRDTVAFRWQEAEYILSDKEVGLHLSRAWCMMRSDYVCPVYVNHGIVGVWQVY
jgi:hypothetical protein